MKLIAGSILIGFSLLSLTLAHLDIYQGGRQYLFRPDYSLILESPVEIFVVVVIVIAVSLMGWELWRMRGREYVKKEARKILDSKIIKDKRKFFKVANYLARIKDDLEAVELLSDLKILRESEKSRSKEGGQS